MKRGEIRWYAFRPPDKRRPILLLTREDVIEQLGEIVAVPVTPTVCGAEDFANRWLSAMRFQFGGHEEKQ